MSDYDSKIHLIDQIEMSDGSSKVLYRVSHIPRFHEQHKIEMIVTLPCTQGFNPATDIFFQEDWENTEFHKNIFEVEADYYQDWIALGDYQRKDFENDDERRWLKKVIEAVAPAGYNLTEEMEDDVAFFNGSLFQLLRTDEEYPISYSVTSREFCLQDRDGTVYDEEPHLCEPDYWGEYDSLEEAQEWVNRQARKDKLEIHTNTRYGNGTISRPIYDISSTVYLPTYDKFVPYSPEHGESWNDVCAVIDPLDLHPAVKRAWGRANREYCAWLDYADKGMGYSSLGLALEQELGVDWREVIETNSDIVDPHTPTQTPSAASIMDAAKQAHDRQEPSTTHKETKGISR